MCPQQAPKSCIVIWEQWGTLTSIHFWCRISKTRTDGSLGGVRSTPCSAPWRLCAVVLGAWRDRIMRENAPSDGATFVQKKWKRLNVFLGQKHNFWDSQKKRFATIHSIRSELRKKTDKTELTYSMKKNVFVWGPKITICEILKKTLCTDSIRSELME